MRRRDFLLSSSAAALWAKPSIQLSLSVRVAESFESKEKTTMSLDALIALAKSNGYRALCMRGSQAGVHTPREKVAEMAKQIRASGLRVSMITGDFAVARNDDHGPDGLRKITPYLDLAQTFGADLIRVAMKKEEDIPWAQKAADEARERRIRLVHQSHHASLFETVDGSLRVLRAIDRPNFGIIYEPANWFLVGEDYGPSALTKVRPYIFNVYVQNHRLNPAGSGFVKTWKKGVVKLDHIGMWEKGGVDFDEVLKALRSSGYSGYLTVHQAFAGVMPVEEAARRSAEYLRPRV
ncbi:MAG: sugar phosphate isomerase/epimerase family protein [Bryobacteraceae bacterium]